MPEARKSDSAGWTRIAELEARINKALAIWPEPHYANIGRCECPACRMRRVLLGEPRMSIAVYKMRAIECDGYTGDAHCAEAYEGGPGEPLNEVRKAARMAGWFTRSRRPDLCPEHRRPGGLNPGEVHPDA